MTGTKSVKLNTDEVLKMGKFNLMLVEKGISGNILIDDCVRISQRCVTFSQNLAKYFKGHYGCEIFFDKANRIIAFKPSDNRMKAYSMGRKKRMLNVHSNTVQHLITELSGIGNFQSELREGIILADLNKQIK